MQIIPLTGGFEAVVDDDDAADLRRWAWQIQTVGTLHYARRSTGPRGSTVYLHRQIMGPPSGFVVDHIDGNGLNNRRANLRLVTHSQNLWNRRKKADGVCFAPKTNKWRATIGYQNKKYEIGFYNTREDASAARAYVASVLRRGIAPDAMAVHDLALRPTIRRLLFSVRQ
ncbi:MAG: HNH endonuclease [Rhizobiales bacterium]|nr:HNH endonuclease [Hyphomicrobiales bacterium]